jgi:hypothetical protein
LTSLGTTAGLTATVCQFASLIRSQTFPLEDAGSNIRATGHCSTWNTRGSQRHHDLRGQPVGLGLFERTRPFPLSRVRRRKRCDGE